MWPRLAALVLLVPLLLSGCATAPSDTAVPARERTVTDQVLAFDSSKEVGGDPGCGSRKVVNTEVTRPFEPGSDKGSTAESWALLSNQLAMILLSLSERSFKPSGLSPPPCSVIIQPL